MVPAMDFRSEHCAWCSMRNAPLADCSSCPKYWRYHLGIDLELSMDVFCAICIHRGSRDLEVFCRTYRFLQEDSGEDFDCYRFCLARKT